MARPQKCYEKNNYICFVERSSYSNFMNTFQEKGIKTAHALITAMEGVSDLVRESASLELNDEQESQVWMEFLLYFLFKICDHIETAKFSEQERNDMSMSLFAETHKCLIFKGNYESVYLRSISPDKADKLKDFISKHAYCFSLTDFIKLYDKRMEEYSAYRTIPGSNVGFKGVLGWEFANKITKLIGGYKDPVATLMIHPGNLLHCHKIEKEVYLKSFLG